MIVTLDGPAGAGKSSAAKALAKRLGFEFLDTGAMYRAMTLAAMRQQLDLNDQSALAHLAADIELQMISGEVLLNGEDVTSIIRTKAITVASGAIANSVAIRRRLVDLQRTIADGRDFVCEGRDQGTIVFPDAICKFFLTADPAERARRRQREITRRGESAAFEEVLAAQQVRDERDLAREIAPMVSAADAIVLDTTHLTLDEVVERMEKEVRSRMNQPAA